jgi:hypothetical protein
MYLYKLRSIATNEDKSHIKESINNETLWHASPDTFKDPHDIKPEFNYDVTCETVHRMISAGLLTKISARQVKMPRKVVRKSIRHAKNYIIDHSKILWNDSRQTIGVCSLTSDVSEPRMWDEYADHYKGIAIEISIDDTNLDFAHGWLQVGYSAEVYKISIDALLKAEIQHNDSSIFAIDAFRHKFDTFKHEREYRHITLSPNHPNALYHVGTFNRIILGHKISDSDTNWIRQIAQTYKIQTVQARRNNIEIEITNAPKSKDVLNAPRTTQDRS